MKVSKAQLMGAAVAGILGATLAGSAHAQDSKMKAMDKKTGAEEKGKCMGGNACAGKGACAVSGQNDCHGKAAKGKGWVEKSKTECDAMAKKDKNVKFEAMNK